MRTARAIALGTGLLLAAIAASWTSTAQAQQILIDKPVRAGELVCFPDLNDPLAYYYVNDKPHLSMDANGKPQFSFLRYVENVRSGAAEAEAREGEGGGIVHAVVALSVPPEMVTSAQRELQRLKPGAKLMGPVVYKSGKFGLVSSFKDTNGNLTKQVVGLGNAPLLDGEKAAVSMQLTKLGAKILWESFQTPTPDISFTFEMDMSGYRSPHRAVIEANFDQIYEHKAFAVGVATQFLAAEVKGAFDDLKREGAIKLTQVGEDEKLDALITTAYNKISDMMFSPLGGTGTPDLSSLAGTGGQPSMLDRATTMLAANRAATNAENEKIRADNKAIRAENRATDDRVRARDTSAAAPADANANADAGAPANASAPGKGSDDGPVIMPAAARRGARAPARRDVAAIDRISASDADAPVAQRKEETAPTFAVLASFEMKSVHQRGIFKIDLNKYTTDNLTLRFDENIGDMRSLMKEGDNFRQVNLDDPLYKQRELVVFVDGMNAKDFGDYINFATVQLRKTHQGGDETQDEVRIDRKNFNSEGNAFKLLYGWKGDSDRRQWMNYEYQTTWSFFGGKEMQQPWKKANAGAIDLAPPFQKKSVDLQADPDAIAQAGVRSITVKVYYKLGDTEQVKQATLNATKGQLSDRIDFILPSDKNDYDYEINWRLKGNRTVSSGRKSASDAVLFVDEVPAG
ncbi:MAG TPA: hypothetical protein VK123_04790 [Candidatus Limnocylindrales bacterium]|nr:hypothetical protein [Candidatus Limnocylindrales bacterium]